jgi:hypothetical protein
MSFGRQATLASTPAAFLELEDRVGRSDQFAVIDALVETLLRRSLRGEQVAALTADNWVFSLAIAGLDAEQRAFLAQEFMLEVQQGRGAWFLPETVTLDVGWANFPFYFQNEPTFATGITAAERGKVRFLGSADALFFWSVLEPLFENLYYPFALRGPLAGTKDRDWQRNAWHEAETFLDALNFDVRAALAPMRYGGGWSKLRAQEQIQAKQALLQALRHQGERPHAAPYRAHQVQRLLSRYYRQAKKDPPKLRQVVTRGLQPVLTGYFGGDWLAFLAYIGEEPHPDERIATTLPETRLIVADRERVAAVAAAQGLPAAEVERALAAFWGSNKASSPIEERVDVLRSYWREFDVIHARQRPGMSPLWGLVDDGGISLAAREPYQAGLYRTLLTSALLEKIDRLWGACMLTRWPDRLVSAISPHALVAEALGPALKFWHGCALTAWFLCEGPYSRTDLPGLAGYYARELAAMEQPGCPVDPALFEELQRAESHLGPQQGIPDPERTSRHAIGAGISLTFQVSIGTRRDGFEVLRGIISRYQHTWSEQYLETYLRSRWETEIRDAARDFSLLYERKGKAPNPKQFATHAVLATNHWFGGDMGGLYRMIGEKSPIEPKRYQIMPDDREAFARSVYQRLVTTAGALAASSASASARDERSRDQVLWNLQWMAEESLRFLQREEALGRPPTLEEFGRDGFMYRATALSPQIDAAWSAYQQAIEAAQQSSTKSPADPESPAPVPALSSLVEQDSPPVTESRSERMPFWRRLLGSH